MPDKKSGKIKLPDNSTELKAWLAEYSSLRQESIATIGYRIRIITWGFIGLTLILTGLFATKQLSSELKILLLILVAPQISKASLLMWCGEYERMIKAGHHIIEIEEKVNSLLQDKVLTWEKRLKKEKHGKPKHMYHLPYISAIFILSLTGWTSHILALFLLFQKIRQSYTLFATIYFITCVYDIIAILEIAFLIWFVKHWINIRQLK